MKFAEITQEVKILRPEPRYPIANENEDMNPKRQRLMETPKVTGSKIRSFDINESILDYQFRAVPECNKIRELVLYMEAYEQERQEKIKQINKKSKVGRGKKDFLLDFSFYN